MSKDKDYYEDGLETGENWKKCCVPDARVLYPQRTIENIVNWRQGFFDGIDKNTFLSQESLESFSIYKESSGSIK